MSVMSDVDLSRIALLEAIQHQVDNAAQDYGAYQEPQHANSYANHGRCLHWV